MFYKLQCDQMDAKLTGTQPNAGINAAHKSIKGERKGEEMFQNVDVGKRERERTREREREREKEGESEGE